MVLQKIIRPALEGAGITKRVGWHTFRHSMGADLRFLGVDVKVAHELLRHASPNITLDIYTQAVSSQKRAANDMSVEMLLPVRRTVSKPQHSLAPSEPDHVLG
jgi:site-specific recombinase XerD